MNKDEGNDFSITIITVTYNAQNHLRQAIESVLAQTYSSVEYIIIDGASTDDTLDIIRSYEDAIDHWMSEPDEGIYNAMNKGIALATGDIIGLVNADDVIYSNTLERVAAALSENPKAGFTMGSVELALENGTVIGVTSPLADDDLATRMWREMPCPHQGMYVKREIYETIGLYEEHYRLRADYDLLLRLLKADVPYVRLERPVGFFRLGGQSGGLRTWLETRRILAAYNRPKLPSYLSILSSVLKMILSKILPYLLFKKLKRLNRFSKQKLY